ncbi:MAG: HigA family addiction module antitoxin [Desulfobacterales bacterium]|nr:HigA family addiction module antitoxin [Desulfobacterales bacterium]
MTANELLDPITPGEILREDFMEPLGISINKLSRDLSVPPNRISEIVNGKRSITADTALRLQRYFSVEAQFWLNLQTEYDLRIIKRKIWPDIERRIMPVKTTETGIEHSDGAYPIHSLSDKRLEIVPVFSHIYSSNIPAFPYPA